MPGEPVSNGNGFSLSSLSAVPIVTAPPSTVPPPSHYSVRDTRIEEEDEDSTFFSTSSSLAASASKSKSPAISSNSLVAAVSSKWTTEDPGVVRASSFSNLDSPCTLDSTVLVAQPPLNKAPAREKVCGSNTSELNPVSGSTHADSDDAWRVAIAGLVEDEMKRGEAEHVNFQHDLPLCLDLAPALLQFALQTKVVSESHVAVASLTRLLLKALCCEDLVPRETWNALKAFGVTKQVLLGRKATYLERGLADYGAHSLTPAEFVSQTNSGQFSVAILALEAPLASAEPGPKEEGYLNMLEAARTLGENCSYHPPLTDGAASDQALGKVARDKNVKVTLAIIALDGMMVKLGHKTDERNMVNVGAYNNPVDVAEAQRLIEMTDDERRIWLKEKDYTTEYVEVMVTFGDSSLHGHLGYEYKGKGGGAEAVRDMVENYLPLQRICYCCLKDSFQKTEHSSTPGAGWALSKTVCDKYCELCMAAQTANVLDPSKLDTCAEHMDRTGKHWTEIRCSACTKSESVCHNLSFEVVSMDCCGSQEAYQNQVHQKKIGMFGTGDHHAIGDLAHMTKSAVNGALNYYIIIDGDFLSIRQLIACYHDVLESRRSRTRNFILWSDLEAKNKFDVQARVDTVSRELQEAILSEEERKAGNAVNQIIVVSPELHFFWRENAKALLDTPSGMDYHQESGLLFFIESTSSALRVLRFQHTKVRINIPTCVLLARTPIPHSVTFSLFFSGLQ